MLGWVDLGAVRLRSAGLVLALGCAAGVALTYAPPSHAQSVSPEQDRQARAEFLAGRDAFTAGDFASAVRRFQHAYELSRRPQLLYNIGAAHDRLHEWEAARDAYHRFLDAVPEAAERSEVLTRLGAVDFEIERARRRAGGSGSGNAGGTGPEPSPGPGERPPAPYGAPVPASQPGHPWRVVAGLAGGLGVLSGVTSLSIGLLANGRYNQLLRDCGQAGCPEADIDDLALRATLTNVFLGTAIGLGVVAVGALVVDLATGRAAPARRDARLHFGVLPHGHGGREGASLVLTGAF